jgi:hemolysin activation/secretion protein
MSSSSIGRFLPVFAAMVILATTVSSLLAEPTPPEAVANLSSLSLSAADDTDTDLKSRLPAIEAELGQRFAGRPVDVLLLTELRAAVSTALATGQTRPADAVVQFQPGSAPDKLTALILLPKVDTVAFNILGGQPPAAYLRQVRAQAGAPLSIGALDADAAWLERAGYARSSSSVIEPGAAPGTSKVTFLVVPVQPFSVGAGYANNGTRTTDRDRLNFDLGWTNIAGTGQQAFYQLAASPDFDTSVSHSTSYIVPLAWRHLLTFTANYGTVNGDLPAPFDLEGYSSGAAIRYDIPLRLTGRYVDTVYAAFDYKRSDNNLEFAAAPVSDTLTEIGQLLLGYEARLTDRLGQTSFTLQLASSPGGLFGAQDDADYNASRAGADASYTHASLRVTRFTRLPRNFAWVVRATGQLSSENLLGSEQLAAGGFASVRGFEENATFGDRGWVLQNELLSPSLPLWPGLKSASFQLLGFYDNASVGNVSRLAGETSSSELSSAGLGTRLYFRDTLSARFDYGWQLHNSQPGAIDERGRGHVAASFNYSF